MNRYEKEVTYHKRRPRSEFRNVGTCFQFETTRKLTRVLSDLSDPQAPVALWVLSSTLGYQSLLNRLSSHRSLAEEHEEPPIEILTVSLNCLWFSCLMLFHYLYISICSICVMIFYDILSLSSWISRLAQVCCNSWETTPCRSICWPTQCMTSLFIFFQRETRALTASQAGSGYVWVFFFGQDDTYLRIAKMLFLGALLTNWPQLKRQRMEVIRCFAKDPSVSLHFGEFHSCHWSHWATPCWSPQEVLRSNSAARPWQSCRSISTMLDVGTCWYLSNVFATHIIPYLHYLPILHGSLHGSLSLFRQSASVGGIREEDGSLLAECA